MNMIGFVFCVLAALALGSILDLEKQLGAHRLRSSYLGNLAANRHILDQTTSAFYASLKFASSEKNKEKETLKKTKTNKSEIPPPPPINPTCSRLNLFSLIDTDSIREPELYEMAAKLFKAFYGETLFEKRPRAEYKFLDAFLVSLRLQKTFVLEKVAFKDPKDQMLYYKMLKGTKQVGYPSLLDYIKVENAESKICLFHAHPNFLGVYFTPKGALKLYETMHVPNAPLMTPETIVRICQEVHAPLLDQYVLDRFEMQQHTLNLTAKTTILGVDPETKVVLRKVVHSPKGSSNNKF